MKSKRFKVFSNNNTKSKEVEKIVIKKLEENDFVYSEDDFELAIAVGGDGSFLRMVKQTNFNSDILYVGINAGTLGFAQEVSIDDIDDFIKEV